MRRGQWLSDYLTVWRCIYSKQIHLLRRCQIVITTKCLLSIKKKKRINMCPIPILWMDLCGLQDSSAWSVIFNTIGMQKFCNICKYHDTESENSLSDMTKLLKFFIFKSAVKHLISLICLQRVAVHLTKERSYFSPVFQRIQILAHTPGIYHRVYQASFMLVNIMLSIKWCSPVFLNLMTTWNNCWAMWVFKFFLSAVSSLM